MRLLLLEPFENFDSTNESLSPIDPCGVINTYGSFIPPSQQMNILALVYGLYGLLP